MIFLIIFLLGIFITLGVAVMAGISDWRSMTIPNSFSLYVIAAFFICYGALYFGGHDDVFQGIESHLISAALTFAVTFVLFSIGVLGAGDSKFGTACAFWVGAQFLPIFLFYMTLCGGLLGGVALYIKKYKPFDSPAEGSWIAQVQSGKDKVPYGIAICFGLTLAFFYSEYFSADILSSFIEEKAG